MTLGLRFMRKTAVLSKRVCAGRPTTAVFTIEPPKEILQTL